MARKPRYFVEGQYYHIIQRGNNKEQIFYSEGDYIYFLQILKEAGAKYPCQIYAYCLMPNHFHLLMSPLQNNSISNFMKFAGVKHVRYTNKRYNRTGTLWEGRFRSSFIDDERYFTTCLLYIELNPVRAKLVKRPESYLWSSYSYRAFGNKETLVTLDPWYKSLGESQLERQRSYRKLLTTLSTGV